MESQTNWTTSTLLVIKKRNTSGSTTLSQKVPKENDFANQSRLKTRMSSMTLRIRSLTLSRIRLVTSTMAKHVVVMATMSPRTPTGCTSLGMNWRSWIIWLMAWRLLVRCQQMFERSCWRKRTSMHHAHVGWRKRLSTRQTSWNYMDLSLNIVCLPNITSYFILLLTNLCHDGISMTLIFYWRFWHCKNVYSFHYCLNEKFLKIFKKFKISPNFISFLPFGTDKQNWWNWMSAIFSKLLPIFLNISLHYDFWWKSINKVVGLCYFT